ncbi:cell division protein FtsW [Candidatus Wolfebacteria bacterium]|nr:cell division protein FtsW [Candidatus Wolfebacteria bacterium]
MKKSGHRPDYVFISCIFILVVFGLIMLSSASSDLSKIKFNNTYYYLKHQIIFGLSLGLVGFLIAFFTHYRFWQKFSLILLLFSIFLLILVFIPSLGFSHSGAKRWLDLGIVSIQPAEFLKFTFIVYLAAWLNSKDEKGIKRRTSLFSGYLPFLIISGLVGLLIILQPSTSTVAIIMAAGLVVYFVSGARLSFVFGTILLGLTALILVISITPYRFARIETYFKFFFNTESINYEDDAYHLNKALISIGSGGLTGVGFGNSVAKFKSLPEPISDSIFAVIAEELGFIGSIFLISVFILLFIKGIIIAKNSRDYFAKLTVIGFISIIAIQTFIHIAANSGILPLTGVPLPFISYGGTALAIFLTMSGVIVNISKYTHD